MILTKLKTLRIYLFVVALFAAPAIALGSGDPAAGSYKIDPSQVHIGFDIAYMLLSSISGHFDSFSGTMTVPQNPKETQLQLTIDTTSLVANSADRTKQLKSPDFFSVDKYPKMTFRSQRVVVTGGNMQVSGLLTIQGDEKPIALSGKIDIGGDKISIRLNGRISRNAFGKDTWNKALEMGLTVGHEVSIFLKGNLVPS